MTEFVDHEWDDIVPIPQDEGPDPVAQIAYDDEFIRAMDIFRALIAKCEYSQRAFDLTTALLEMNPASYTAWQFRRECLRTLSISLSEELSFMDSYASENPKNYQIWFHRRAVVEMLGDASRELAFTQEVFESDTKNYHAWAHRQWAIQRFGLWEGELEFAEAMILDDVRNNSAWNQRWWVVHSGPVPIDAAILDREMAFVLNSIHTVSHQLALPSRFKLVSSKRYIIEVKKNESSWNYLRGLARFHPELTARVMASVEDIIQTSETGNYLAMGLLADLSENANTPEGLQRAKQLMEELVHVDSIRSKSWYRRLQQVNVKLVSTSNT